MVLLERMMEWSDDCDVCSSAVNHVSTLPSARTAFSNCDPT